MKKLILSMLLGCMAMGCFSDPTVDEKINLGGELVVSFEDDESRIQLNEEMKTVWTEGDLVSVFYKSNGNERWKFNGKTGDRAGTLSRVSLGTATTSNENIVIVYPYNEQSVMVENGDIKINMPAEQSYIANSYGAGSSPMVGESTSASFTLRSVCGWFKLQMTGNAKVKSIVLRGNNGEQLAGEWIINPGEASCSLAKDVNFGDLGDDEVGGTLIFDDTITLNCEDGVQLNGETPTPFYIAVPPQNFEKGITVTVCTDDNKVYEQSRSNAISIRRNTILPMKSFVVGDMEDFIGDDEVKILRTNFEGADVQVTIPQRIKDAGRRIKWGVTNIAMLEHNGNPSIPELLGSCDYVYPASLIERDTLLEINHHNAYRRNNKGEIGYYIVGSGSCVEVDPNSPEVSNGTASAIQYYYNFQPGEPIVLLMSEVDYADCSCNAPNSCGNKHHTVDWWNNHWGSGWYWFPYNLEAYYSDKSYNASVDPNMYWQDGAWYKKIEFRLPQPSKFNGSVKVDFSNLTTKDGLITFTPDDQTFIYLVGIIEETNEYKYGYADITRDYLDGDESLWQWFTTSEMAHGLGIVSYYYATEGVMTIKLSEYFSTLVAGRKYHVVVNALGKKKDQNGDYFADVSAQNFQHLTFQLKEYTLPEPTLVVTADEPFSPWKVSFNVKNPDWKTNPVETVSFVANYTREFDSYMKANGYNYTDMVMMNYGLSGYKLSDTDVKLVNSDAGATVEFDVFENSEFTAAFMAWNKEGRPSNPDSKTYPGHATVKSLTVAPAEALDMTKLNALKGDWTATATVMMYDAKTGTHSPATRSWKVSIGDLTSPSSLPQSVYDLFNRNGINKTAADAYFAEFKGLESEYNQSVLGQNRILCQGWQLDDNRNLSTASPWDLFTMEDYNASSTDYLFQDFGPKWFIQTNAQGGLFVPVNYNRIPSLTSWYNGQSHYLCGGNYEIGYAFPYYPYGDFVDSVEAAGLPVTVSKDGNTVTITGYTVNFEDDKGNVTPVDFYPNILYGSAKNSLAFYNNYVVSDVVLTRGWIETRNASKMSANGVGTNNVVKTVKGIEYTKPNKPYGRTVLLPQTKKQNTIAPKRGAAPASAMKLNKGTLSPFGNSLVNTKK